MSNSDISYFFEPNSIAVIGASSNESKVGHTVLKNIIDSEYKGKIFPINPSTEEILGLEAYPSVLDVDQSIDIAIFVIPSKYVNSVAKECGEKGVRGLIVISAGFKEIGSEGAEREEELKEIARKYDMRVLGPNCLGIIGMEFNGSFAVETPKKGKIAMISQSGAFLTAMMDYSMNQSYGFCCNISLGNKADLSAVDFIEYLADYDEAQVILCYLESIKDGDRFLEVVPYAAHKKPVIILKAGVSEAGARAASSHTGALAGSDKAYNLAFNKCGVIRAKTMEDLFDYGEIFLYQPIPERNSFAIITNAGGPGIVATDAFSREGLKFAEFSENILHALRKNLPREAAIFNPIDIVGDATPERYEFTLKTIFGLNNGELKPEDDNYIKREEITTNGALIILSPQAQTKPTEVAKLIQKIWSEDLRNKPLICAFIGEKSVSEGRKYLKDHNIPCYIFPDRAAHSLKTLINRNEFLETKQLDKLEIPEFEVEKDKVSKIIDNARDDDRTVLLATETAEIFHCYGIKAPQSKLARTPREAMNIQKEIGSVIMKVTSPQIVHKTDVGGIAKNIQTPEEAFEAFIQIIDSSKKFGPQNAKIYGVEVQEMIDFSKFEKITEIILGMSRDAQFGPMLMFGAGGIYANFLKDVSFALGYKFTEDDAKRMLQETKIYRLLQGVRGESPSDIDAIIEVLLRLSQLVKDFPDIVELDINPLLSFTKEYSAVDIKITISRE
ncbi:MAG: CoA-binding protein [Candidatus Lokiarchaeota archaeon]|nr:CoA-binding protein [Candidatus Lokiarchaeota archaeon]MBD3199806.1 CoA-binding protein [Candidatus Lokiarchaeota archaeon]